MEKVVLILFLAIGTTVSMSFVVNSKTKVETIEFLNSDYNDGWKDGFCEGWKDVKGQFSVCPATPVAPVPHYSCSEGYKCGYNRGFKYGMCKAKGGDCAK